MQVNITKLIVLLVLGGVSYATLRRLIDENNFPAPKIVGRSLYFDVNATYEWLSKIAGRKIKQGDKLLSSKQLTAMFQKSDAWTWTHFQKNKERKAKAVYIRSRPYWIESEVLADKELQKYLEVLSEVQEVA